MEKTKILPNISKASLQPLTKQLASESVNLPCPKVAVVGVGNALRSDDAAGVLAARELLHRECATDVDHILILEGGQAPESLSGQLRKFAPDLVLFIDAANLGEKPGTVQWISEECIDGMSASTHSLPLSMLARYLSLELNCEVIFLGIQPRSNEVGEFVSAEVQQVVHEVVQELDEALRTCLSEEPLISTEFEKGKRPAG
jgi:hydrogenase 3 maturation protease